MDRINFVVADDELGMGIAECAEPVINDESLVEIVERAAEKPYWYAGLAPEELLAGLHEVGDAAARNVQVLGCICGYSGCSWATVDVITTSDEVVWSNVRASHGEATSYAGIGPFRFERRQYDEALARPVRARAPVRRWRTSQST